MCKYFIVCEMSLGRPSVLPITCDESECSHCLCILYFLLTQLFRSSETATFIIKDGENIMA